MIGLLIFFLVGLAIGRVGGELVAKRQFYRPLRHNHCAICHAKPQRQSDCQHMAAPVTKVAA